jgi:hypothetical protein
MKLVTGIVITIAVLVAGFLFFYSSVLFSSNTSPSSDSAGINLYANGTYGISFPYSENYLISEGERGTSARPHYAIVLTHKDNADLPLAGGGPPTISIDIYDNSASQKTLESWIATTPESNVTLGSGKLTNVSIDGEDARAYRWSGFYEGETTVLLHGTQVIAIVVTTLTPEDAIVADYQALLEGLTLSK